MLGSILVSLAFATALISTASYGMALRSPEEKYVKIGRMAFHTAVVSFMLSATVLMYLIITHQFEYTYVVEHSSRSLSTPFLMAAFYAGQEGSFMLWTLFTALIGVFVIGYAQRVRYEAPVMAIFMFVLTCLLLILVVKSPFETIFQTYASQNLTAADIPRDGRGLNPQLENLWITIHPPILFTGFAAMTVPFVFALAGLIKRDYQRWISIALPWTLFASMALGFGIMLGGWWAYETLGWGGFWAWDPVENSSLIPWLVCVALVHTMLVQKRTGGTSRDGNRIGGLVKTNFLLAILAFGLILYSTFLTRSGVLGDTSVHSFVSPGAFVYAVLLTILILFVLLGLAILFWRWKDLRQAALEMQLMSRESALGIGSSVLLASATVVLLCTSWPLFMPLFGLPKIALPVDVYNIPHLVIGFFLMIVNGISMTLKWKNTTTQEFMQKIAMALGIATVGTIGLVLLGIHDPIYIALGFGSLLAMVVNIQIGAKVMRGNPRFVGAYVSHAGVALLMLGVIFTARYSVTEHVRLVENEPQSVFGYSITYTGSEQIEMEKTDRSKYRHNVVLEKDGSRYEAGPITFLSDFNKRESPFMEPDILYTLTKDIYIAPNSVDSEGGDPVVTLAKGEKTPHPYDSSVTVRFEKFDMSRAQGEGMQGAVVEAKVGDSAYYLTSYKSMNDGRYQPVMIPGTDLSVYMADLKVDKANLSSSQVVLAFASESKPAPPLKTAVAFDVSIKPFISFVWFGVIIMVGGFFFSIIRRRKEIDLFVKPDDEDDLHGTPITTAPEPRPRRETRVPIDEPIAARGVARK